MPVNLSFLGSLELQRHEYFSLPICGVGNALVEGGRAYTHMSLVVHQFAEIVFDLRSEIDQPKPRSAQQPRHKHIRFAYGAASATLRPAS